MLLLFLLHKKITSADIKIKINKNRISPELISPVDTSFSSQGTELLLLSALGCVASVGEVSMCAITSVLPSLRTADGVIEEIKSIELTAINSRNKYLIVFVLFIADQSFSKA